MQTADLAAQPDAIREQAAALLVEEFSQPAGWPTLELAREEVAAVLAQGFARAAVDGPVLIGWIGGLPEYNGRVWELHPVVVRRECRRRGIGRALVCGLRVRGSHARRTYGHAWHRRRFGHDLTLKR